MNLAFDTLTAAKKMEEVGMERKQAEVLSHIIAERQGDLVTKADIAEMVTKADIADMVTKADIADFVTKAEFAEVKGDLKTLSQNVRTYWTITMGFMVPLLLVILAIALGVELPGTSAGS